jgi:hypothetical protein
VTGVGQQLLQQTLSSPVPSHLLPSSNSATTRNSGGKVVTESKHSKIIKCQSRLEPDYTKDRMRMNRYIHQQRTKRDIQEEKLW